MPALPLDRVSGLLQWQGGAVKLPQKLPAATVSAACVHVGGWVVWRAPVLLQQTCARGLQAGPACDVACWLGCWVMCTTSQFFTLPLAFLQMQSIVLALVEHEQEEQRHAAEVEAARSAPQGVARAAVHSASSNAGAGLAPLPPHLAGAPGAAAGAAQRKQQQDAPVWGAERLR